MKILKWVGIVLGVIVGLVVLFYGYAYFTSEGMLNKTYTAPTAQVVIPTDAAAVERGKHITTAIADCIGCHGANFAGGVVFEDPAIGRIVAPNLTRGKNGFGSVLSDADFVRVIRYGVLPNGKSVRVMPSDDFVKLSDADLGAVIAYVKSVPPVDSNLPEMQFQPLGRILMALGQLPIMIAERINFNAPRPATPAQGVNAEYGKYLASVACMGCHGEGLAGGKIPGTPPDFPQSANLTPSGEVGGWTEAQFIQTLRTGKNPAGKQLINEMPWQTFKNMTDDELKALWVFVHSVPAKPAGTR